MADAAVPPRKILLCGDVGGSLNALYKRFETVNKAAGPFEAIFCVGRFCGAEEGAAGDLPSYVEGTASAPVATYFVDGLPGGKGILDSALLPADGCVAPNLYFLRGAGVRTLAGLRVAFAGGHFDPLSYRDASAAGAQAAAQAGELRAADVSALLKATDGASSEQVDLLLTAEWPRHVAAAAAQPPPEVAAASVSGPAPLAELAAVVAPRYHAAAAAGVFYARAPYRNRRGGITRFVGLAPVGAPAGQKWLHALNLVPAVSMTAQQLCAATTDTTPSPYMAGAPAAPGQPQGPAGGEDPAQPWRWAVPPGQARPGGGGGGRERAPKRPRSDDAGPANTEATIFVRNLAFGASDDDIRAFFAPCGDVVEVRIGVGADGRPRGFAHVEFRTRDMADAAAGLNGTKLMDREVRVEPATERMERPARVPRVAAPGEPAPGCWFCLSNGKDTQLLVSIAAETYVALDKGALTPQHVLLIPVEHYPSSAALPLSAAEELWRYSSALRRCFAAALGGAQLVCFERHLALRGKGGNHAHINCVPLPAAAAASAKGAFEAAALKAGFAFAALPPLADAAAAQQQLAAAVGGAEYFCVTLPDGERLVHALAQGERMNMQFGREVLAELLGTPDKADWRNCTIDATGEEQRAAKFKELFAKHDPFLGE